MARSTSSLRSSTPTRAILRGCDVRRAAARWPKVERRERGGEVIFKAVRDGKPYPDHGFSARDWANVPPRSVRLDELTTIKRELALDKLLDEDSTFYGDLFPHAVQWDGDLYLEDGLHRAVRAAL